MVRILTVALLVLAGAAYAQSDYSDSPAMKDQNSPAMRELNRRLASCRDFTCYYQWCVDLYAHADEVIIQALTNDPAALNAQRHNLWRNRPSELRRNCTDTAQIRVSCHGNENCIVDGDTARDSAKREGQPMTEQDWRDARCVRESMERGEDRETTRLRCGRS
jgi:hypothetical protein